MPTVAPGANSWQSGRTVQTRLQEMDFQRSLRRRQVAVSRMALEDLMEPGGVAQ